MQLLSVYFSIWIEKHKSFELKFLVKMWEDATMYLKKKFCIIRL